MPRRKGNTPDPEVIEREAEVLRLRRGGLTWDQIAQRTGYADPTGPRNAYIRACQRIVRDDVESIRTLEEDRLDTAQAAIWSKVIQGDLRAVQTLVRIMERRAKLLGLDMPIKVQQEVTVWNGDADLDREIQDLISRMDGGGESLLADIQGETGTTSA